MRSYLSQTKRSRKEAPYVVQFALEALAGVQRRRGGASQVMAMLPNDHHPGPRCSCGDCLSAFPEDAP